MRSAVFKLGVGLVVLLVSVLLWWKAEDHTGADRSLGLAEVPWNNFPVLRGEGQRPQARESTASPSGKVVFVYAPYDCYTDRDAMNGWHRAAERTERVKAVNVLLERSRVSAQRYLSVFSTPYSTRLDSTGWFRKKLNLATTPAVVLLAREQPPRVFYPTQNAFTPTKRQRYLADLRQGK